MKKKETFLRDRLSVDHWHYNGDNDDNTLHVDNISPVTQPVVKG